MRPTWRSIVTGLAAVAVTTTLSVGSSAASGHSHGLGEGDQTVHSDRFTFAVVGAIPYGDAQIANFPNVIRQINADPGT